MYKARNSRMQTMILKGTIQGMIWVDVPYICAIFPQIIYQLFHLLKSSFLSGYF